MRQHAESIESRLAALEDAEAIRNLIAFYGPLADSGQADAVAMLWEPDGIYAIAGIGEAKGRKAIADLITGPQHQSLMNAGCAHLLGPVAVSLSGTDAEAWGHSVVVRQDGGGFGIARASANHWVLRRSATGWRVVRRDNAVLDGDPSAFQLFSGAVFPLPRK